MRTVSHVPRVYSFFVRAGGVRLIAGRDGAGRSRAANVFSCGLRTVGQKECRAGADAPLSVGVKGAGSCHCKEGGTVRLPASSCNRGRAAAERPLRIPCPARIVAGGGPCPAGVRTDGFRGGEAIRIRGESVSLPKYKKAAECVDVPSMPAPGFLYSPVAARNRRMRVGFGFCRIFSGRGNFGRRIRKCRKYENGYC